MAEPRLKILDVVQVSDDRVLAEAGLTGRRGAITKIREYPGPRFRYSVRGLTGDDDDDDEVAGLYDEEHLQATGERATAELFALPGGFRVRQVVTVSAGYDNPDIAGRTGVRALVLELGPDEQQGGDRRQVGQCVSQEWGEPGDAEQQSGDGTPG